MGKPCWAAFWSATGMFSSSQREGWSAAGAKQNPGKNRYLNMLRKQDLSSHWTLCSFQVVVFFLSGSLMVSMAFVFSGLCWKTPIQKFKPVLPGPSAPALRMQRYECLLMQIIKTDSFSSIFYKLYTLYVEWFALKYFVHCIWSHGSLNAVFSVCPRFQWHTQVVIVEGTMNYVKWCTHPT